MIVGINILQFLHGLLYPLHSFAQMLLCLPIPFIIQYLDQLDRYIRFTLGYKYYGRYVDDFYIITTDEDRPQLLNDIRRIRAFLHSIGLELHPKKCCAQPVEHGAEFLGATVYLHHFQPGRRVMRNYSRTLLDAKHGKLSAYEQIASYEGLFSHFQADRKVDIAKQIIELL